MPNIVTLTPSTICSVPIPIGERGENVCSAVRFDFTEWADEYGEGAVSLLVKRKGDTSAYPVVVPVSEHVATWTISNTDTAVHGYGKAEFVFTLGDLIAKTAVFSIYVANDIGPNGEPPEPIQEWMDELVALGGETLINAQAAQAAQEAAETAQESAETAATNAATSATNAAQSAGAARDMAASALSSADRATASATAASGHATAASASATQAAASASAAAESAESASGSATTATTAATNASASAQSASASATSATQNANIASNSATIASGAATTATNAATNAAASATSASGSATAASTSETNAAQSATSAAASATDAATEAAKLNNYLPTDTASGSIASLSDGADSAPVKALAVSLEPVQNLNGQASPYPAGGGKNLFDPAIFEENGGVLQADGSYYFYNIAALLNKVAWDSDGYEGQIAVTLIRKTEEGRQSFRLYINYTDGTKERIGGQFATGSFDTYTFVSDASKTVSTVTFDYGSNLPTYVKMQVEKGDTATAWSPYSNICPITGHTDVELWRAGVNVWDEEIEVGGINDSTGEKVTVSTQRRTVNYVPVVPETTYYAYAENLGSGGAYVYYYDADKAFLGRAMYGSSYNIANRTFTTPTNCRFVMFKAQITTSDWSVVKFSINYPSTDHDYHAHSIVNISIPLGQTVYGATIDLVGSVCKVDRAMVVYDGSDDENWDRHSSGSASAFAMKISQLHAFISSNANITTNYLTSISSSATWGNYDNWISSSSGGTINTGVKSITDVATWRAYLAENPLEVCYELYTPTTIQLSDIPELTTLYGQNNIWSDSGDVDVTYRADIQKYIAKVIAEAIS